MAEGNAPLVDIEDLTGVVQAIRDMATAMLQQNNQPNEGAAEFKGLSEFKKNKPSEFKGGYDPEKSELWIKEMEKIFKAMACTDKQKVTFATFMLVGEAEYWWDGTQRLLEVEGIEVTWEIFKTKFLDKYFPADLRRAKEIEFLELKQGRMIVGEYAAKKCFPNRAPIVAKCDRKRVLSSWVPYCCNMVPEEFQVEFSSVRHLSPQQFVEKLSKELRVRGVVAGKNYRFGYKAAGDALELAKLCEEYGIEAYIIKSVMDKNCCSTNINFNTNSKERGQVSSTRVREALAVGDMRYVSELLGRKHRLILMATDQERFSFGQYKVSAPKSCLLNLAPKEGLYEKCSLLLGQENVMQCRVIIDSKFVHIETDYRGQSDIFGTQNLRFLHIEFGDSSN